jgi:hypothetical protein
MEIDRNTMKEWVIEALQELGGSGEIVEICKKVWEKHKEEITAYEDLFYKWQYEIRWAGDILRKEGKLVSTRKLRRGIWKLTRIV